MSFKETLTRQLSEEEQGMIETDGKAILIFDASLEANSDFSADELDDEE